MKPRLYFDTSVFGGVHDIEFQYETELLFEMVRNREIICVYSDLSELELENAPQKIVDNFLNLPNGCKEFIEITKEVDLLAKNYIKKWW